MTRLLLATTALMFPLAAAAHTNEVPPHRHSVLEYGATCDGATDDSQALADAATSLRDTGSIVYLPPGCRLRMGGASQVWLRGVALEGDGVRDTGPVYGQQGGTIIVDTATASPFVVSSGWGFKGLKFYWPGQQPAMTPTVFPALVTIHGTDVASGGSFENNQVINAYDILDLSAAGLGSGHTHIDRNQLFALHYYIHLANLGGESWITDNQFSPVAFSAVADSQSCVTGYTGTTPCMYEYASANSEAVRVTAGGSVDGLRMSGNYFYLPRYAIHLAGGTANLWNIVDDSYDQVMTAIQSDSGGGIGELTVTGGLWLIQRFNHPDVAAPAVWVNGAASSGNSNTLTLTGVNMGVVAGPGVIFTDSTSGGSTLADPRLTINGGTMSNIGNIAGSGYRAVEFSAPYGALNVTGVGSINSKATGNVTQAIHVTAAHSLQIASNNFYGWTSALYDEASDSGVYAANTVQNSTGGSSASEIGAGLANLSIGLNASDVEVLSVKLMNSISGGAATIAFAGPAGVITGGQISMQGAGGLTITAGTGQIGAFVPGSSGTQVSAPRLVSAGTGQAVTYTSSSGDVAFVAGSGGATRIYNVPLCSDSATPPGSLCSASGSGSAVSVK